MKLPSRKILAFGILFLILLQASTLYYFVNAPFEGPLEDLPFYVGAPLPYSYIFDRNSTHTFAFNGTTGYNAYSGTNETTVIQNAVESLPTGGSGKLFFKTANYTLDAPVTVDNLRYLKIECEGANYPATTTTFHVSSGTTAFYFNGEEYGQAFHCELSGFTIRGDDSDGTTGLKFKATSISTIHNVVLTHLDEAIHLEDACHCNTFQDIKILYCNISIFDDGGNFCNEYENLWCTQISSYGYYMNASSNHVTFDHFKMDSCPNAIAGIYVPRGKNVHVKHGYFVACGSNVNGTAIYIKGYPEYPAWIKTCSIRNTYISQCANGIRTDYVDYCVVENNYVDLTCSGSWSAIFSSNTKHLTRRSNIFDNVSDLSVEPLLSFGASWIVFDDGAYFCMQDSDGTITARSTNASRAIDWTFGNLTSGRTSMEQVLLKGDFNLSTKIIIPSYTELVINGKIFASPSFLSNTPMIETAVDAENITIRGGIIQGSATGRFHGIKLLADNCKVSDIHFARWDYTASSTYCIAVWDDHKVVTIESNLFDGGTGNMAWGVFLRGGTSQIIIECNQFNQINRCFNMQGGTDVVVTENVGFGVSGGDWILHGGPQSRQIWSNNIFVNYGSIWQTTSGSNNSLINNMFINCSNQQAYPVIQIMGDYHSIVNNRITIESGSQADYALELEGSYCDVYNNQFGQGASGVINIVSGSGTHNIKNNRGYVTENSGTATDKANGGTQPHGLVDKPTVVTLTCLNATYDGEPVLVFWDEPNTDSTNISLDIYWVNGTAITDAVIHVSWYAKYMP